MELLKEQERIFDKKEAMRKEKQEWEHKLKMEEIKAERELEEFKQKNFLIRRNVLGEISLTEDKKLL